MYSKHKLKEFFKEIAELTINHDVIGNYAVVYPNKLGEALEKVDPEWYKTIKKEGDVDEYSAPMA